MNRNAFSFSKEKRERFSVRNEEIAERYQPERLLRDTSYITNVVRKYLQRLYPADVAAQKVGTTKGPITAELRNLWGLNAILRDGGSGPKKRDDLRHHAVDAAVIAVTSESMIQETTKKLQQNWPKRPKRAQVDEPWDGFGTQLADAVKTLTVSHRVERKLRGALHKETNYWRETNGELAGKYITRKPLSDLSVLEVERICDNEIRELARKRLKEAGGNTRQAFAEPLFLRNAGNPQQPVPVRKVRIWTHNTDENMIQIRENAYAERPQENHHTEIFRICANGQILLRCKTWDMWDIAGRIKRGQPVILRRHPEYRDAVFVMSLAKGEYVQWFKRDGSRALARVKQIGRDSDKGQGTDIHLWELHVGRLEGRITRQTPHAYRIRGMNDFRDKNITKVTIDPLGRVRRAND